MSYLNKKKGIVAASALTLIAAAAAAPAYAADGDSVQDLDQRVRVLERQLEIQKEESDAKAKDTAVVTADSKGFSIKNAKGDYELQFHALVQADARLYNGDNVGTTPGQLNDTFVLRRVEPTLSGSLGKYVGFLITPEFNGSGSSTSLLDFWGELRFDPAANIRVGRFKEPVGLENLQSSPNLTFIERGLPTDLVPGREIGAQLHGQLFTQTLSYAVGLFNGAADGGDASTAEADNRHDIAARLFAEPFKNSPGILQNLGFGVAGTIGSSTGPNGASITSSASPANNANVNAIVGGYKTVGQNTFFSYRNAGTAGSTTTTYADGRRSHLAPQAYWYNNNYGILAEYVISRQELSNKVPATVTSPIAHKGSVTNKAYEVVANYVITGEDASYKGVKPKNAFKIGGDGWGAFEVAARTGALTIGDDAFAGTAANSFADATKSARKATEYGLAANWYLNNNAKVAVNYEETRFDGGATIAQGGDRATERAILARLQVAF